MPSKRCIKYSEDEKKKKKTRINTLRHPGLQRLIEAIDYLDYNNSLTRKLINHRELSSRGTINQDNMSCLHVAAALVASPRR